MCQIFNIPKASVISTREQEPVMTGSVLTPPPPALTLSGTMDSKEDLPSVWLRLLEDCA